MNMITQILINLALYGFLLFELYRATVKEWDPWYAFVVAFVLVLAGLISVIPGLRAPRVSPGRFPYESD